MEHSSPIFVQCLNNIDKINSYLLEAKKELELYTQYKNVVNLYISIYIDLLWLKKAISSNGKSSKIKVNTLTHTIGKKYLNPTDDPFISVYTKNLIRKSRVLIFDLCSNPPLNNPYLKQLLEHIFLIC